VQNALHGPSTTIAWTPGARSTDSRNSLLENRLLRE
jgi:hypothetical protein